MSCLPPTILVGGVLISTSDFQNAQELIKIAAGNGGDPTYDEYEENISRGNNTAGKTGILVPSQPGQEPPKQTTLPPPIKEVPKESSNKPPPGNTGNPIGCTIWNGSYDAQLSPNLTLSAFTTKAHWPHKLIDYKGFSIQTRFCNLQNLSTNIAEPLLKKYGKFSINSGLRNSSSVRSGFSQHETGEGADFQFPGWTYDRYWEAAQWVRDNLPFDQFLFEHGQNPWLHLSYRTSGSRAPGARDKVMTMYRGQFSPGLQRHG